MSKSSRKKLIANLSKINKKIKKHGYRIISDIKGSCKTCGKHPKGKKSFGSETSIYTPSSINGTSGVNVIYQKPPVTLEREVSGSYVNFGKRSAKKQNSNTKKQNSNIKILGKKFLELKRKSRSTLKKRKSVKRGFGGKTITLSKNGEIGIN